MSCRGRAWKDHWPDEGGPSVHFQGASLASLSSPTNSAKEGLNWLCSGKFCFGIVEMRGVGAKSG